MIKYQAKIKKDGRGYLVEFPDLKGCFTYATSKAKALESARESLSLYLEESLDPKWKIPTPKKRRGSNYIWITPFADVAIPIMIRKIRQKHKKTQKELANLLGITYQQLQKLETPGKSNPTVKTLAEISKVLNEEFQIKLAS